MEKTKEDFMDLIDDVLIDLFYYDRKECEEFPVGSIEQGIKDGIVTVDELVERFRKGVVDSIDEYVA